MDKDQDKMKMANRDRYLKIALQLAFWIIVAMNYPLQDVIPVYANY
jgi:hypothetical protein